MNREELRTRILFLLNEDADDPAFFTTTQANTVIQEAMEIIAEEITDLKREAFVPLRKGKWLYTTREIAEDCMTPFRVWSQNDEERLDVITMQQLDDHRERWMEVTTERPDWWFPVSFDCFGVWPTPSNGGNILRINYLAWPETLLDDSDEPEFREAEQDLIVLYGMYDGLIRQWEPERALDIFSTFAQSFKDQQFKTATRKFQHMFFNRDAPDGAQFPRP